MKKDINFIGTVASVMLLSAVLLSGCEDTDYPAAQPATTPSTNQARFLFVNAAPGAPALNFFVENTQAGQSLGFGQASAYIPSQVGNIQLRAKAASGQIGGVIGSGDILFRAGATNQNNFAAAANTNYTVFVTDTLNRPRPTTTNGTNPGGPQFLTVTDNLATPAAGNAHVRFFHLAPDAPAVSVRLVPTAPASVTATPAFLNRAYRVTSVGSGTAVTNYANFTPVSAATYTVQVYTGATVPTSATVTPALTVPNVTLETGKIYTMYARGLRRNNSLGAGVVIHN
ncbi:DUF4397 domain-containing protein [Spirosoma sp. 209]|uniref:DUF4397 domain-containing protein n=1 Tax=Spirosoma sp. 209 TaxID=1955701 RepID=UPI00098D16C5|nr:DUF4397 domain-containing protein [Spirosoma sp. 209]